MPKRGCYKLEEFKERNSTDSTTEEEYIAVGKFAKEAVWMHKFIDELGVVPTIADPIDLYCDNNGAIALAKEPRSHKLSMYIQRKYHLIRELIDRGKVHICKVSTLDNIADLLIKALSQ